MSQTVPRYWGSLERPPSLAEVALLPPSTRFVDLDLTQFSSPQERASVIAALRGRGIQIFAYHVGNGGGRTWGEGGNLLSGEAGIQTIYNATRQALQAGADGIHLDNPDRLSSAYLEQLMDAQVRAARELGRTPVLHLKNAPVQY